MPEPAMRWQSDDEMRHFRFFEQSRHILLLPFDFVLAYDDARPAGYRLVCSVAWRRHFMPRWSDYALLRRRHLRRMTSA